MSNLQKILTERQSQHGDFTTHAHFSQKLKRAMESSPLFKSHYPHALLSSQTEALEMIQHKIGRILAGDPNHIDHWDDIAGYATLVANNLREAKAGSS